MVETIQEYFIKGNVPSSKNSKQFVIRTKRLIDSKTTRKYKEDFSNYYLMYRNDFVSHLKDKNKPYKIAFKFIRDSKRKFDYHNAIQVVADLMVKYGWIEDDNADIILPVFEEYEYSKENPGVVIKILK